MIGEKVQELIASKSAEWRPFEDQIAHWMRELAREVLELAAREIECRDMGEGTSQCAAFLLNEAKKL